MRLIGINLEEVLEGMITVEHHHRCIVNHAEDMFDKRNPQDHACDKVEPPTQSWPFAFGYPNVAAVTIKEERERENENGLIRYTV